MSSSSRAEKGYPPWAVVAVVPQKKVLRICSWSRRKWQMPGGDGHDWNWLRRCQGKKNFEWWNDELLGKEAYFIWRSATGLSLMNFLNECWRFNKAQGRQRVWFISRPGPHRLQSESSRTVRVTRTMGRGCERRLGTGKRQLDKATQPG